jgi:hypothetical protein
LRRIVAEDDACPSCGSPLLQPLRWAAGAGAVEMRCPECESCFRRGYAPAAMAALEARQVAARRQLVAAHEQLVSESMEALAGRLREALEQDLVGPDDFAPRSPLP